MNNKSKFASNKLRNSLGGGGRDGGGGIRDDYMHGNGDLMNSTAYDPYQDLDRDRPISSAVSIVSDYNNEMYNGVAKSNSISVFSALYNQGK